VPARLGPIGSDSMIKIVICLMRLRGVDDPKVPVSVLVGLVVRCEVNVEIHFDDM